MDITDGLKGIGFSDIEAEVYKCVLKLGSASLPELVKHLGRHQKTLIDRLQMLVAKEILIKFRDAKTGKAYYQATEPANLQKIIEKQQKNLNIILPMLEEIRIVSRDIPAIDIQHGAEAFSAIAAAVAKSEIAEEILVFSGGCTMADCNPQEQKEILKELEKMKSVKMVFPEMKELTESFKEMPNFKLKIYPEKYKHSAGFAVVKDEVLIFHFLEGKATSIKMKSEALAETYRTIFSMFWDQR